MQPKNRASFYQVYYQFACLKIDHLIKQIGIRGVSKILI
ncbi:hypothetical protein PPEP_b0781 [Pseudoalteromonas peptidolytica F12-50-A1]|uniref:Uncharacterized protein n=1 Tax=Pseudoalteromonas peptidolytica F12-50-A1 TaxID=1315280 RepID=A0A8I0T846_9GAMM|nr:hypothetical protein [Pseudoalteromonas peptidolytica F12-50-A1]